MENITRPEVLKFLQVVFKLSMFEAEQRMIRGYGAFKESELPKEGIADFVSVMNALKFEYNITEEEIKNYNKGV